MRNLSVLRPMVRLPVLFTILTLATGLASVLTGNVRAVAQAVGASPAVKPTELRIANAPIPMRVLVQSPAETESELQIICLFRSDASNTLHGSLMEANEKLKGLLDRIRKPTLFRGELGETLLIDPPAGSLAAKRLLMIGLGDSETFTAERMELVGAIAYREASRLGVARPFFGTDGDRRRRDDVCTRAGGGAVYSWLLAGGAHGESCGRRRGFAENSYSGTYVSGWSATRR